jgi:BCCT family betaine/carnitine transporter
LTGKDKGRVDWPSFSASIAIIALVCLPLAVFPEAGERILHTCYEFIAHRLGFLYALAGLGVFLLLAWLAFGRYGKVKLGRDEDDVEYSDFSWVAMLFCAGVGAGLLYWAMIEWSYYYAAPPFGVAPRSGEAVEWASTYGIFHWGVTAWCFYCLPTLAIAYPYYVKRVPYLRFSTGCHYFLGGEKETASGRCIDLFFMIALLGGAGSSLGFSTPMLAACIARLTGLQASFGLEIFTVLLCVALFGTSVWFGLNRGIKRLSNVNLVVAFALLLFVFATGPTLFMLKTSANSIGVMLLNFPKMNWWTDLFTDSAFFRDWTVFYWAWWIAYAPFVGLFVTRISRGRTLRQVIFGMTIYGSLGGGLFYMVLGNFGLELELNNSLAVTQIVEDAGEPAAIVSILDQLPLPSLMILAFAIVSLIFSATTYDSASYTLASSATLRLEAGEDPARWHRLFWAITLTLLPLTLMAIGDLKVMQTAVLIVSLPILAIGVVMSVALVKQLAADQRRGRNDE